MKHGVLVFTFTLMMRIANAQIGSPDSTWDTDGKVNTDISGGYDFGNAGAIQPDGFIVVAGLTIAGNVDSTSHLHVALVRYNPKGALDSSFGTGGIAITQMQGYQENSVAIQPDGKIIVAGTYYFYDTLDRVFGVLRYNPDGSPDNSFSGDGMALTKISHSDEGTGVAVQPDGKILVAGWGQDYGYFFEVVRYNQDGSLDSSFNDDGIVTTQPRNGVNICSDMALQRDGKIVVGGYASGFPGPPYSDFALIRYNTDGFLDSTFGGNGIVFTDIGSSNEHALALAVQPDGKILASGFVLESSGNKSDIVLARYNADGSLDNTFSLDGIVTTDFGRSEYGFSVAIQPDGKIAVGGYTEYGGISSSDFAIARYNADGTLDNSFGTNGKVTTDFVYGYDYGYYAGIQPNGRIILAGAAWNGTDYDFGVARYLADFSVGVEDFSFENHVLIYPNPVSLKSILKFELPDELLVTLCLTDVGGRQLYSFFEKKEFPAGENQVELSLPESLIKGYYLLQILTPAGNATVKFYKAEN